MLKKKQVALWVTLTLAGAPAMAAEIGAIQWNGFLNAGYSLSNSKTLYAEHVNNDGTAADSGFGLAASAKLPEDWSAAMQLFTHGGHASSAVTMDWAFATYAPNDNLALRVGRIKYPGALVSEVLDVGFVYPWFHPPEEFYTDVATGANMTAEKFDGISPLFKSRSGSMRYVLQPYAGQAGVDDGDAKKLIGVVARASGNGVEALFNVTSAKLVLETTSDRYAEVNHQTSQRWNVGASLDRDVLVMVEYGKSKIDGAPNFDSSAGYATLGYHFGKFLPSVTYGFFDQKSKLGQKSVTATLRYEMNSFAAVKMQFQRIDPDERETALAGGAQPAGLFASAPVEKRVNVFSVNLSMVY